MGRVGKLYPYETDVYVPIFVRGPRIADDSVSHALVGNHDIAPTLAEVGGATPPDFVDGRSFLSGARGNLA